MRLVELDRRSAFGRRIRSAWRTQALAGNLSPGRLIRLALALGFLGALLWYIDPGFLRPRTLPGRVNAPLLNLRAPISGKLEFRGGIGDRVTDQQILAIVTTERFDETRLKDLQSQRAAVIERGALIDSSIGRLESFAERLNQDTRRFQELATARLGAQLAETRARLKAADARAGLADRQLGRADELRRRGVTTAAVTDERLFGSQAAQQESAALRQEAARIEIELKSAAQGVFIGDSFNNSPYSSQRRDEIRMQVLELERQRGELRLRVAELDRQIATETEAFNRNVRAAMPAFGTGIVWEAPYGGTAEVARGDLIAQIADCGRLMFETAVAESDLKRFPLGADVLVDLDGPQPLKGHVAALRGGADADLARLAVNGVRERREQFQLLIQFENAADGQLRSCPIGHPGEVRLAAET